MADKLNLTVHHRNAKGKIVRKTPYRLAVVKGVSIYEMPSGSGEFFLADGTPYEGASPVSNKPSKEAVKAQELEKQNAELQAKIAQLEAKQAAEALVKQDEKPAQGAQTVTPVKAVDSKDEKKS